MGTRKKYTGKSEKLMVFQINELSQLRYQRKEKEDDVQASTRIKKKSSLFKKFWRVIKMKAQRLNVLYVKV